MWHVKNNSLFNFTESNINTNNEKSLNYSEIDYTSTSNILDHLKD